MTAPRYPLGIAGRLRYRAMPALARTLRCASLRLRLAIVRMQARDAYRVSVLLPIAWADIADAIEVNDRRLEALARREIALAAKLTAARAPRLGRLLVQP